MAACPLLDTHALLWWLVKPEKLSPLAQMAIIDPAATIFVSAASGAGGYPSPVVIRSIGCWLPRLSWRACNR